MKIRTLFAITFLTAALTGCFEKKEEAKTAALPEQPSKVLDYLELSAYSLISQQQPDGFFRYEYDFITGAYTPWDNIIHQTRAGFALMQYYLFMVNGGISPQSAPVVLNAARKALNGYKTASVYHNSMPGALISFYYNKKGAGKKGTQDKFQRLEAEIAATAFALTTEQAYWSATNSDEFLTERKEWRSALLYHARQALMTPLQKRSFMAPVWLALTVYNQNDPADKEVENVLKMTDAYFMKAPRPIKSADDFVWDMVALRRHGAPDSAQTGYTARQTAKILDDLYAQHETGVNNCLLSLGLVEAALILRDGDSPKTDRIRQAALGRGQLEYYNSLKYTILSNQTWISLGPGRTLHSQDFKRFTGAAVLGIHSPRTNIGVTELCLLAGMRFTNEDLKELQE